MAIGFKQTGGGDGGEMVPVLKYNAKAGRIYRIDRENDGTGWITNEVEITNDFVAVFDMENIEVGWMRFAAGQAPDFQVTALGEDAGNRPSDAHKEGFRVMVKLGEACGGDKRIRELATTAAAVKQAFSDLHDAYLAGVADNPGKLPVVKLSKVTPVTTTNGGQKQTNYAPEFAITGWASRPADLIFKPKAKTGTSSSSTQPQAGPPATGSTRVTPPAAAKPAPAMADAENFG